MRRLLLLLLAGAASPLRAQMGPGTSWLPDAAPMHAAHHMLGRWTLMLHGKGFLQYDWQGGSRGSNQLGIVNWAMAAASRPLGGGQLQLRAMLSAEPWTIGGRGYPLLVQSGESYKDAPLHDRQHPHDLFMELAALYERPVARNLGLSLYLAPVGEPAVGPVAFPHRPSAADDPLAPISHHWQDGTHITFGVVTRAVHAEREARGFLVQRPGAGRESDELRLCWPPTRFLQRPVDRQSGAAVESVDLVRLPEESRRALPRRVPPPHRSGCADHAAGRHRRDVVERADLRRERSDWARAARVERRGGEHP